MAPWRYKDWSNSYNSQGYGRWSQGGDQHGTKQAWSQQSWLEQWACLNKVCNEACKKKGCGPWQNPMSEGACRACGGPKPAVTKGGSMLQAIKAELNGGGSGPKKSYLQAATSGVTVAQVPTQLLDVPIAKPSEMEAVDDEEVEEVIAQLALTQEYSAIAHLLGSPPDLVDDWSAEVNWNRFLPKRSTPDLDKLDKDILDQTNLLDLIEKQLAKGSAPETKKKLAALEKQRSKAGSGSEEALKVAAYELEHSAKLHEDAETARVARTDAAALSSTTHSDRLEAICQEQMAAWEKHLDQLRAQRSVRESAWEARRMCLENRALEIQELATKQIEEAHLRAGTSGVPTQQVDLRLADAAAELKRAQEENHSLVGRLEALEKMMQAQQEQNLQATAQLTAEATAQCFRSVMYSQSELPELKANPSATYKKQLVLIASNLRQWERYGQQPVSYASLLSGAGDAKATAEAFRALQEVAGDDIWKRFYGDNTVLDGQLIPLQMREVLLASLLKADAAMAEFAKLADYEDEARARFLELQQEDIKAKKGRTGPYSAA